MASLKKSEGKKAKKATAFDFQMAWRLEEDEVNLPVIGTRLGNLIKWSIFDPI